MRHPRAWLISAAMVVLALGPTWAAHGTDQSGKPVTIVTDPAITESSGLVARNGEFLTVNDAGNPGVIFIIDAQTGDTTGTTFWADRPDDVEALSPGTGDTVWVGDIGDNQQTRDTVKVTQVPVLPGDQVQAGSSYSLVYPDGPHDAETLLVHPQTQQLFIVTKDRAGGTIYAAPEALQTDQPNQLTKVGDVARFLTDGAFFPSGNHIILRGYGRAYVYSYPDIELIDTFRLPKQEQGEGIAVDPNNEVYTSSEGTNQPIIRIDLPPQTRTAIGTPQPTETTDPEETPDPETPPTNTESEADTEADSDNSQSNTWILIGTGAIILTGLAYGLWVFTRRRN